MASTAEPRRSPDFRPSRRTLLAGAALVAPATLLPAIAAAAEDTDPHPAWWAEWRALTAFLDRPEGHGGGEVDDMPEFRRAIGLEHLIGVTPARSLAGALVQLRMLRHWTPGPSLANDGLDAGLTNALATLERLAGEARA
jgi:hypothetical protein